MEKSSVGVNILIIDGQGGGVGAQLVSAVKAEIPNASVTAIGTNSFATNAMLKAGADNAATGENAVITCCRRAEKGDFIIGSLGIIVADSLLGEVTCAMAAAVGQSRARRVLIPTSNNKCDNIIAGMKDLPLGKLVQLAVLAVKENMSFIPNEEEGCGIQF